MRLLMGKHLIDLDGEGLSATYDADFHLIAAVTGQRCRWVVPSGSMA